MYVCMCVCVYVRARPELSLTPVHVSVLYVSACYTCLELGLSLTSLCM